MSVPICVMQRTLPINTCIQSPNFLYNAMQFSPSYHQHTKNAPQLTLHTNILSITRTPLSGGTELLPGAAVSPANLSDRKVNRKDHPRAESNGTILSIHPTESTMRSFVILRWRLELIAPTSGGLVCQQPDRSNCNARKAHPRAESNGTILSIDQIPSAMRSFVILRRRRVESPRLGGLVSRLLFLLPTSPIKRLPEIELTAQTTSYAFLPLTPSFSLNLLALNAQRSQQIMTKPCNQSKFEAKMQKK